MPELDVGVKERLLLPMDTDQLRLARAADATVVAELAFTRSTTDIGVVAVTPLVHEGHVVVALPYARRALADELAAAEHVAMVFSDDRMALRGWEPLAVRGRVEVEHDSEGDRFRDDLIDQELRKHPPSRTLTDSLRDRHDHWWYLPRLLCRIVPTAELALVGRRSDPSSGLLAWLDDGLEVDTVEVTDADEHTVSLRSLADRPLRASGAPATLFRHDYSRPDLERRSERHESGRLEGEVLGDVRRSGELSLPGPPGLIQRYLRHRELAKACRRELARVR